MRASNYPAGTSPLRGRVSLLRATDGSPCGRPDVLTGDEHRSAPSIMVMVRNRSDDVLDERPRFWLIQLLGMLLLVVIAVALTLWLVLRPSARIAEAGATPGYTRDPAGAVTSASASSASGTSTTSATPAASATTATSTTPAAGTTAASATPVTSAPAIASASSAAAVPVAFVGDGLTSTGGVAVASPSTAGTDWATRAASALEATATPISATTAGQDGAGYATAADGGGLNFAELVPQAVSASTEVVVLLGSSNDSGSSPERIQEGVSAAVAVVHQISPSASVLVVGPPALDDASLSASQRAALRRAAVASGATFADPVALGWSLGANASTTTGTGVHLTDAGQAALAQQVVSQLTPLLTAR